MPAVTVVHPRGETTRDVTDVTALNAYVINRGWSVQNSTYAAAYQTLTGQAYAPPTADTGGGGSGGGSVVKVDGATVATIDIASTPVTAADIPFTPTGTIAAATVQAAIAEAAAETGTGSGGAPADADAWMGFAATTLAPSAVNNLVTAGNVFFARVTRGSRTGATRIGMQIGTSSGNVMVGVYRATGSGTTALPGALAATSGIVACPAAGYQEITLQAPVDVAPGDYLALWADNITATFGHLGNANAASRAVGTYNTLGTGATALPAGPLATGVLMGFGRHYMLFAA